MIGDGIDNQRGERRIDLPDHSYLVLKDSLVIKDVTGKALTPEERARNLYKFDASGMMMWQVAEYDCNSFGEPEFIEMKVVGNELIGCNWNSYDYRIDLETGKVLSSEFVYR